MGNRGRYDIFIKPEAHPFSRPPLAPGFRKPTAPLPQRQQLAGPRGDHHSDFYTFFVLPIIVFIHEIIQQVVCVLVFCSTSFENVISHTSAHWETEQPLFPQAWTGPTMPLPPAPVYDRLLKSLTIGQRPPPPGSPSGFPSLLRAGPWVEIPPTSSPLGPPVWTSS